MLYIESTGRSTNGGRLEKRAKISIILTWGVYVEIGWVTKEPLVFASFNWMARRNCGMDQVACFKSITTARAGLTVYLYFPGAELHLAQYKPD